MARFTGRASALTFTFVAAAALLAGTPAHASGVFETPGTVRPETAAGEPDGCPYFSRWVYVSPGPLGPYNPNAPFVEDDLGADAEDEGTFADGVSIALTPDGHAVRVTVDEAVDPLTTIMVTRIFVQTAGSYAAFTNEAIRTDGTVLDPPPPSAVDHAFVCYEPLAVPMVIPEVPWSLVLPISAAAVLGGVTVVRRRRAPAAC